MAEHAVVIGGGGPTGLMLAGELALAGVDVAIVERRASRDLIGARAGGLHSRTIEVLDQRGIADRFLSQGQLHQVTAFHKVPLDIGSLPTRHNYFLGLWQQHIERTLADWVDELGVRIYRRCEVTGFTQNDVSVDLAVSDGRSLRAEYLVGCDGGRSVIRKSAGVEFVGSDATQSWLLAEVQMTEEPAWGFREDATGTYAIAKLENGRAMRVVLSERTLKAGGEPTLSDVSEALTAVYGTDYGIHTPATISRFTDMTRQAAVYRDRRVLLAGDAAHVHPPMGWAGSQHRRAGCGESGMEAGAGGRADIARKPAGYLSRRAPPGRRPGTAQYHGGRCASPNGRPHKGPGRHPDRTPRLG